MRDYSLGSGGDEDPLSRLFSEGKKPTKARKVLQLIFKSKKKMTIGTAVAVFCVAFLMLSLDVLPIFGQEQEQESKRSKKEARTIISIDPMAQVKKQALEVALSQPKNELKKSRFLQKEKANSYQNTLLPEKIDPEEDCLFVVAPKNDSISQSQAGQIDKNMPSREESNQEEKKRLDDYAQLVAGHPIEKMLPFIVRHDKKTASFLIAIAKKESNWGVHAPQKNDQGCFNYWGYRGTHNQTASGYSCFDSAEQAVEVVGKRIRDLIEQKIDTPEKMIVWKCGKSCAGHDRSGVLKWISDVAMYYEKAS